MNLIDGFFIVYGGGKFGNLSVDSLKRNIQQYYIVVIDSNPNCFVGQLYRQSNLKTILHKIKNLNFNFENCIDFVQGDILTLIEICKKALPQYLIPTAPIHVMKDFLLNHIQFNHSELNFSQIEPKFLRDTLLPENLNLKIRNKEAFFSYAPWDVICIPNCPAPSKYCSTHDRIKPIDLNLFLDEFLRHFEENDPTL